MGNSKEINPKIGLNIGLNIFEGSNDKFTSMDFIATDKLLAKMPAKDKIKEVEKEEALKEPELDEIMQEVAVARDENIPKGNTITKDTIIGTKTQKYEPKYERQYDAGDRDER